MPPDDRIEVLRSQPLPNACSWATAIAAPAEVSAGGTLCLNYDAPDPAVPFLAINAARNIIAINAFPADKNDIQKFWLGRIPGNAVPYLVGNRTRGTTTACRGWATYGADIRTTRPYRLIEPTKGEPPFPAGGSGASRAPDRRPSKSAPRIRVRGALRPGLSPG